MPWWLRSTVEELRRDRRKAALLAVLAVVGVVVAARFLMNRPSPASADAAVAKVMDSRQAIARSDAATTALSPQDSRLDQYVKQIDRKATRDLFGFREDSFPLVEPLVVIPVAAPTQPAATQASQPDAAEVERRQIQALARSLTLQSVISGSSPTAIINDRTKDHVLRVGDTVRGFEVVRIADDCCVVQKNGVQETLRLVTQKKAEGGGDAPE